MNRFRCDPGPMEQAKTYRPSGERERESNLGGTVFVASSGVCLEHPVVDRQSRRSWPPVLIGQPGIERDRKGQGF